MKETQSHDPHETLKLISGPVERYVTVKHNYGETPNIAPKFRYILDGIL